MANAKIISDLVESLGLSVSAFERNIEASNGAVSKAIEKEASITKNLKEKILRKYPSVSESWLDSGEGEMFIAGPPPKSPGEAMRIRKAIGEKNKEGIIYVPIPAQAGYSKNFLDPVYLSDLGRWRIEGLPYEGERFRVFQVKGDSMEYIEEATGKPAGFFEGMDVVAEIVEPEDWKNGVIPPYHVYVIVMEDEIVIKRLLIKENGDYVMHSDNPNIKPRQRLLKRTAIRELWYVKRKLDWGMAPPEKIEIEI